MNARQRCRFRRKMHYREQCKREEEIRQLRLQSVSSQRSVEAIIDDIFGLTSAATQKDDTITVLAEFLARLKNQNHHRQTASFSPSFDNCCMPAAYLYSVR